MMTPSVRKPYPGTSPDPKFTQTDVENYVESNEIPEDFLDIINFDVMRSPVSGGKNWANLRSPIVR